MTSKYQSGGVPCHLERIRKKMYFDMWWLFVDLKNEIKSCKNPLMSWRYIGHRNELKIKALRTNLNQGMRNSNEKLCKTTEVMGLLFSGVLTTYTYVPMYIFQTSKFSGIYVVLLTRKRTHNDTRRHSITTWTKRGGRGSKNVCFCPRSGYVVVELSWW